MTEIIIAIGVALFIVLCICGLAKWQTRPDKYQRDDDACEEFQRQKKQQERRERLKKQMGQPAKHILWIIHNDPNRFLGTKRSDSYCGLYSERRIKGADRKTKCRFSLVKETCITPSGYAYSAAYRNHHFSSEEAEVLWYFADKALTEREWQKTAKHSERNRKEVCDLIGAPYN